MKAVDRSSRCQLALNHVTFPQLKHKSEECPENAVKFKAGKNLLEGEKALPHRTKSREQNNSVGSLHAKRGHQKETPKKKKQHRWNIRSVTKDASATAESKPLGQRALPTWGHRGGKPKPTRKNKEKDEETFPHSTCGQPRCCKFKTYSVESTRLWL